MGNADQLIKKRDFINRHLKDSIIMLQELKKEKHEDCLHWFPIWVGSIWNWYIPGMVYTL